MAHYQKPPFILAKVTNPDMNFLARTFDPDAELDQAAGIAPNHPVFEIMPMKIA